MGADVLPPLGCWNGSQPAQFQGQHSFKAVNSGLSLPADHSPPLPLLLPPPLPLPCRRRFRSCLGWWMWSNGGR